MSEDEKNQEKEQKLTPSKKRLIVIETDGSSAKIIKAEVAGNFELKAILTALANSSD